MTFIKSRRSKIKDAVITDQIKTKHDNVKPSFKFLKIRCCKKNPHFLLDIFVGLVVPF